jgi:hypothetical protein
MRLGNMYKPLIVCWIGSSVGVIPARGKVASLIKYMCTCVHL